MLFRIFEMELFVDSVPLNSFTVVEPRYFKKHKQIQRTPNVFIEELTLAVYFAAPVIRRMGWCLHCDFMELFPPTKMSEVVSFCSTSSFFAAFMGGGGAGLDFLCLWRRVPVVLVLLMLFAEWVEGELISGFSDCELFFCKHANIFRGNLFVL